MHLIDGIILTVNSDVIQEAVVGINVTLHPIKLKLKEFVCVLKTKLSVEMHVNAKCEKTWLNFRLAILRQKSRANKASESLYVVVHNTGNSAQRF